MAAKTHEVSRDTHLEGSARDADSGGAGGKRVSTRVQWPKDKPPFGKKEVEQKFRDLASLVVPPDRVEKIVQTVYGLETVKDISELAALLS